MMKLTENQISFLDDFKYLYGLDLSALVVPERSSMKAITIMTPRLSENDIRALERFCSSRKIRLEPNGYRALAIFVGDLVCSKHN